MLGLSKTYFKSGWNQFDLIVVIASLVDVCLDFIENLDVDVAVFRSLRLVSFNTLDFLDKKEKMWRSKFQVLTIGKF